MHCDCFSCHPRAAGAVAAEVKGVLWEKIAPRAEAGPAGKAELRHGGTAATDATVARAGPTAQGMESDFADERNTRELRGRLWARQGKTRGPGVPVEGPGRWAYGQCRNRVGRMTGTNVMGTAPHAGRGRVCWRPRPPWATRTWFRGRSLGVRCRRRDG